MTERVLGRGRVIEYDTPMYPGFVRDEQAGTLLPFYFSEGRFMGPPYHRGEPSFTASQTMEDNQLYSLREPRVGEELVYQMVGQWPMARIAVWSYAIHYDALCLRSEKPVQAGEGE